MMLASSLLILSTLVSSWHLTMLVLATIFIIFSTYLYMPMCQTTTLFNSVTLDTMSIMLIMLTMWTLMLMLAVSVHILNSSSSSLFIMLINMLGLILLTAFAVNNMFTYYLMFEASLIPTVLLIIIWGNQPERLRASMYMIMYTMASSLPLLLGIIHLSNHNCSEMMIFMDSSTMLPPLTTLALLFAFMVKLPLYTFHSWLPKAHVEAPVAGSMILASILLKLGAYGLIRFQSMAPLIEIWSSFIISLSIVGAILTSWGCMQQPDIKAMIAYSSVAHMNLVIAAIASSSYISLCGVMMMLISHGIVSSGLFVVMNVQYENTHTRSTFMNKGMMLVMPSNCVWWFLLLMANMGSPPTINMLSELLMFSGLIMYDQILILPLIVIALLSVVYSMMLYLNINHGPTSPHIMFATVSPNHHTILFFHILPLFILLPASSWFFL